MKKLLGFSSLFFLIVIALFQTSFSSCTKEIVRYDTVTINRTDTLTLTDTIIIKDTPVCVDLLTANAWRMKEIRGVIGNTITYYHRGESNYTENYDNEYIKFNADKTGTLYDASGYTHNLTWAFDSTVDGKLTFVVSNPSPYPSQYVTWENLRYKDKALYLDQYWSYQGINSHVQEIRIPK